MQITENERCINGSSNNLRRKLKRKLVIGTTINEQKSLKFVLELTLLISKLNHDFSTSLKHFSMIFYNVENFEKTENDGCLANQLRHYLTAQE